MTHKFHILLQNTPKNKILNLWKVGEFPRQRRSIGIPVENFFNHVAFIFLYNYIECQNVNTQLCYESLKLDPTMLYPAKLSFEPNMKESTDIPKHDGKHTPWISLEKKKTWHLPIQPRINQNKK